MDPNYCGLSFSVSYYQDRCPIYTDPYHFCSYHGLETDLLNLTACWGLELWRLSTTCTVIIESVKATSVIFLLGVGSFVCYKLYNHYRRKLGGSPGHGKKLRFIRWTSAEELLETNADDLHNIKTKYFGPDEVNSDVCSECSDVSDTSSDSPQSDALGDGETASDLTDSEPDMGNLQCQYEPVLYNVKSGVNFADPLLAGDLPCAHSPTPSKAFLIPGRTGRRQVARRRPHHLDLSNSSPRRRSVKSLVNSFELRQLEALNDCNTEIDPLFLTEDSSGWRYNNSRQGSDADIESLSSSSTASPDYEDFDIDDIENCDSWSQDCDGGSLKANFSPSSLAERSEFFNRLPPDGADAQVINQSPADDLIYTDNSTSDLLKEPLTFREDDLFLDSDSDPVFTSSGGTKGRLVREGSFDSECSELSLDVSLREDIGSTTVAGLDHLLSHLHQLKQSCLNLDADIVGLKVYKQIPLYSDTIKSPLSDSSDRSTSNSGSSALEIVQKHRTRACFKGLLDSGVSALDLSDKSVSPAAENNSASSELNEKVNLSLEWDSPKRTSGLTQNQLSSWGKISSVLPSSNGNVIGAHDSGSDFGTPLTCESPEPLRLRTGSAASLEWDEEFNPFIDLASCPSLDPVENLVKSPFLESLVSDLVAQRGSLYENTIIGIEEMEQRLGSPTLETLRSLSSSPETNRVVPGQSRDCSPLDKPADIVADLTADSVGVSASPMSSSIETVKNSPSTSSNTLFTESERTFSEEVADKEEPVNKSSDSDYFDFYNPCTISDVSQEPTINSQLPPLNQGQDKPEIVVKTRKKKRHSKKDSKSNRDSACFEGTDIAFARAAENIGEKWDIIQYSETEWRGHTARANTIREGYADIPKKIGCHYLRRIRGDNYCAIRATLFQMLAQGLPTIENLGGLNEILKKLTSWMAGQCGWLQNWSFANRLPFSKDTCLEGFSKCLEALDNLSAAIIGNPDREKYVVDRLNNDPELDLLLMEAVKLMLMVQAIELHEDNISGNTTPMFSYLLFARETSETPQALMENHLNAVGDSGGLEQIEMFLLGYTLKVTLQVIRPANYGSLDYVCYFPDCNIGTWNEVNLIAEDDRHYNVIIK